MKTTLLRVVPPSAVLHAAIVLMAGCNQSYSHRLVSTSDNEVTVRDESGTKQQTHEAPQLKDYPPAAVPETSYPLNDQPKIDLENRIPEPAAESQAATQPAEEIAEGKVSSISLVNNQFVVMADNGDEHTLKVNDESKFTLDGKEITVGDLKVNHLVKVAFERATESLIAKSVEATSK